MSDTRRPAEHHPLCDTRSSVLAAWFISIVVVWPILTVLVAVFCLFVAATVLVTLYPELEQGGFMDVVVLMFGPAALLISAVVVAIACYKICRYIAVPLNESKPLAFEAVTVFAVLTTLVGAFAFWALILGPGFFDWPR